MTLHDDTTPASYSSGMDDLTIEGEIAKIDPDKRQVFGWASVTELNGEPVVDLQNDVLETIELEKAAYDYVLNSRVGGEMHQRVGKSSPKQVGTLIESMVLTPEKIEKMGLPSSTPRGWWIGFQIAKDETGDEVWKSVKDRKYTGFSIHGLGKRLEKNLSEIGKSVINRSPEEIKAWVTRMAQTAGVPEKQFARDLVTYLDEQEITDPSDEDLHEFIVGTYGSGNVAAGDSVKKTMTPERFLLTKAAERASSMSEFVANVDEIAKALVGVDDGAAVYFTEVHKHLIGNHDQKDHDPKKGGFHRRGQHGTKKDPGKLSDTQRRGRITPAGAILNPVGAVGATQGTTMFWRNNWGKEMPFMDNRQVFETDTAAGAARGFWGGGPIGAALGAGLGQYSDLQRERRGEFMDSKGRSKTKTFGNTPKPMKGGVAGDRRKKDPRDIHKSLSKRQVEVLEKYLGPISKKIEQRGDKYVVLSESGKVLGTHDSKQKAARQLAAVEANKDH